MPVLLAFVLLGFNLFAPTPLLGGPAAALLGTHLWFQRDDAEPVVWLSLGALLVGYATPASIDFGVLRPHIIAFLVLLPLVRPLFASDL